MEEEEFNDTEDLFLLKMLYRSTKNSKGDLDNFGFGLYFKEKKVWQFWDTSL